MKNQEAEKRVNGVIGRAIAHECADGVQRKFKPFFWPDMLKLKDAFGLVNVDVPWMNFVVWPEMSPLLGLEEENQVELEMTQTMMSLSVRAYTALIEIMETLFSETYCDKPLSRKEIETGNHIDVTDIQELVKIAVGLASIEKKQAAASQAE